MRHRVHLSFVLGSLIGLFITCCVQAQDNIDEIVMKEALLLPKVGSYGRRPLHQDPIEKEIVAGIWIPPHTDDEVVAVDGSTRQWKTEKVKGDGWVRDNALVGGYAYWAVESKTERVMLLQAAGHRMVYVNNVPRAGDVYSTGWTTLPVKLKPGVNHFLFHVSRGRVRAQLTSIEPGVYFHLRDLTLPDLVAGEPWGVQGGIILINATDQALHDLWLQCSGSGLPIHKTPLPTLAPMTIRKVPFWFGGAVEPLTRFVSVNLELGMTEQGVAHVIDTTSLDVPVRLKSETHRRTFISDIDGSVQYYAVTPMKEDADAQPQEQPALILTLHGAGVEAIGQARVYESKSWAHVVAPTNRRPYGFDWEEWGRWDAMEVLELNQRRLKTDPRRTYLTGHSMGGHGVWQVGATLPDRFAAIGPSAGWITFWSYTGAPRYEDPTPVEQMLNRAANPSDTLALTDNYREHGIYVLHGEKDDNVPITEAYLMMDHLGDSHDDLVFHAEPDAGHWWGNRCCDWPPMMEFLRQHVQPEPQDITHVEFVTANPEVSPKAHWIGIETQFVHNEFSRIAADLDRANRRYTITTENVAQLTLSLALLSPDDPVQLVVDGQDLGAVDWPRSFGRLWLKQNLQDSQMTGTWQVMDGPSPYDQKGSHRYGPFKHAFNHRMVFVYGTQGTQEENEWAYAKARFDAETFWYRGNGAVDIVSDQEFDHRQDPDRGVILYGNADTNSLWSTLLPTCPMQVKRGEIMLGDRRIQSDDLGCLFIYPRPDSRAASVGVISGTGPAGMRLTDRMPTFLAGVHYPDYLIVGPEVLTDDSKGVRVTGYWSADWMMDEAQQAWHIPE